MKKKDTKNQSFFLVTERKPIWKITLKITLIYFIFGLIWILSTDYLLAHFITDSQKIPYFEIAKGIVFVLISSIFIYNLIAPHITKISDNEQVIIENRNELKMLLYYDQLTGLSNRQKLLTRLPDYLNDSTSKGKALIYIDIDNIKLINDSMGHEYGDKVIIETARILSSHIQPPDELYRTGGDELLILTTFEEIVFLKIKTEEIIDLFKKPLHINNTLVHSTISIGISLYPIHSADSGELLKCADIAMSLSKKSGKNRAILFNNSMLAAITERVTIGEKLHGALLNNEFKVFYQPQIHTETHKISSYEALIRWNNPILGFISPDKFISIAEEMHLIIPIGNWVLKQACTFLRKMHAQGFPNLTIAVNISIVQLLQEDFVSKIVQILEETELNPSKLELEITESILIESQTVVFTHLNELRSMGIGIALDDFGKGYSSLSYLEKLPITSLKIDKIFIDGIIDADKDTTLTGNIVKIGKKLGLIVVAEGVETEIQLKYLENQQCNKIQGWIYSKALCEEEAEQFAFKNMNENDS
ncbi:MAG TPA: EAL domain-containing protein [Treponemataceae bacterium]|nr:EAL domain-containing protein [Treponemataceae bacterium]